MYLGRRPESAGTQTNATASAARSKRALPGPNGSLNWVNYGYVTGIKNQVRSFFFRCVSLAVKVKNPALLLFINCSLKLTLDIKVGYVQL